MLAEQQIAAGDLPRNRHKTHRQGKQPDEPGAPFDFPQIQRQTYRNEEDRRKQLHDWLHVTLDFLGEPGVARQRDTKRQKKTTGKREPRRKTTE